MSPKHHTTPPPPRVIPPVAVSLGVKDPRIVQALTRLQQTLQKIRQRELERQIALQRKNAEVQFTRTISLRTELLFTELTPPSVHH